MFVKPSLVIDLLMKCRSNAFLFIVIFIDYVKKLVNQIISFFNYSYVIHITFHLTVIARRCA